MTLEQARCVVEVATCGTFREAANNLYISPSAVSQAISSLENELSIDIFTRTRTGSSLTSAGSAVYALCVKITQGIDDLLRMSQASLASTRTDIIRIGFCNFASNIDTWIAGLLNDYSFSLHYCSISDMEYLLDNGYFDFAFCSGTRNTYLRHKGNYLSQLLSHDENLLVMSRKNPLSSIKRPFILPEEIKSCKWCFLTADLDNLLGECVPGYKKTNMALSSNVYTTLIEAIRNSDNLITLLPRRLIPADLVFYNFYLSDNRAPKTYNYLLYCKGFADKEPAEYQEKEQSIQALSSQLSRLLRDENKTSIV